MKILYLDLFMGAAGDMLSGALFDLLSKNEQEKFLRTINSCGIPHVTVEIKDEFKSGIRGTKFNVLVNGHHEHSHHEHNHDSHHRHHEHHHEHHHTSMSDIEHIISHLDMPEKIKNDVISIYKIIANAESKAHGKDVSMIHFHEVGMMDAITDITSVCLLLDILSADKIYSSPIHVGKGTVKCAHGIMPVPAPATAYILENIPCYSKDVDGELCTPTGAALLKYFVDDFIEMPQIIISSTGYGMGTKEFDGHINMLRAFYGTENCNITDKIIKLQCTIDDMTGEQAAYALEKIFEAGARDAFYESIICKKSRPGFKLTVITDLDKKDKVISAIFKHTSTIGIRESLENRYVLERNISKVTTNYGDISLKTSSGYGVIKKKFESDELTEIASAKSISLQELMETIQVK